MTSKPKTWPDRLYHYTSSHTLHSILKNQSIWLSGRWNLNDTSEGAVFCQHLESLAEVESIDQTKVAPVLSELQSVESYVCCFSSNGDMLSQWRAYANNGAGVSIGFSSSGLIDLIRASKACLLQKVTYADKIEHLEEETTDLIKALLMKNGSPRFDFKQTAATVMWAIKTCAFAEENEYRLILTALPGFPNVQLPRGASARLMYRATDAGLREHYELGLNPQWPSVISEIVLGPKNDSNVEVVRRFLNSVGLPNVPVRRSAATYR